MTDWVSIPYQPRLLSASLKSEEQKQKEAAKRKKKKSKKLYKPQPDVDKYLTHERRQLTLDLEFPSTLQLRPDYPFVITPEKEFDESYGMYIRLGKNFRMRDLLKFYSEYDADTSTLKLDEYVDYLGEAEDTIDDETFRILGTLKHLLPDCIRKVINSRQEGIKGLQLSPDEILRTFPQEFLQEPNLEIDAMSKNSDLYGLQAYFPSVTDGITANSIRDFYSNSKLTHSQFQIRLEAIRSFIAIVNQEYPVHNTEMMDVRRIIGNNINSILVSIEKLFYFYSTHPFALNNKDYSVILEKQTALQLFFYDESRNKKEQSENKFYFDILNEQIHVLSGKVNVRPDLVVRSKLTGELLVYDFKSSIKNPNRMHYKLQAMLYLVAKSCERIWSSVSEKSNFGFVGRIPFSARWFRDQLYEDCSTMRFFFVDLKTGEEHEMSFTREDFEELYEKARRYLEVKVALQGKLKI